jgi:hypothetical protein
LASCATQIFAFGYHPKGSGRVMEFPESLNNLGVDESGRRLAILRAGQDARR